MPQFATMTVKAALKIRRNARAQYQDLREEGQTESDAMFSADENVAELAVVDDHYSPEDVGYVLQAFRDVAQDDRVVARFRAAR